ncbi:MAG: 30S ribosomal protein S2 [Nanobdellota archaeon]
MSEEDFLVSTKQYLKTGIHIGTKFRTKYMAPFIYKTRPDGLSVLNLKKIDERLKVMINFVSQYKPEDLIIVSRRENGWKGVRLFHELTGASVFPGRYPPGILTNPNLENFREAKLMFTTDPWPDRNAVIEALKIGTPIVSLCDTNNQSNNIDLVVPCNNKGKKSLGLVFYLLARGYMLNRGIIKSEEEFTHTVEDFTEE